MRAETWLGAAGCASGSHTWSGITPAFPAKPVAKRTNATLRAAAPSAGAATRQAAKRGLPVHGPVSSLPASRHTSPARVITAHAPATRTDARHSRAQKTRNYDAGDTSP